MNPKKGFTLVELLVCIALLAVVSAVIFHAFAVVSNANRRSRQQARRTAALTNIAEQLKAGRALTDVAGLSANVDGTYTLVENGRTMSPLTIELVQDESTAYRSPVLPKRPIFFMHVATEPPGRTRTVTGMTWDSNTLTVTYAVDDGVAVHIETEQYTKPAAKDPDAVFYLYKNERILCAVPDGITAIEQGVTIDNIIPDSTEETIPLTRFTVTLEGETIEGTVINR